MFLRSTIETGDCWSMPIVMLTTIFTDTLMGMLKLTSILILTAEVAIFIATETALAMVVLNSKSGLMSMATAKHCLQY